MKSLEQLTEREILSVAISSEEDDNRVYMAFAEDLRDRYPATAKVFEDMASVEVFHRSALLKLYEERFGKQLLPIRASDISGFVKRPPIWLTRNLPLSKVRMEAEIREAETAAFYTKCAQQAKDDGVRQLFRDLAVAERGHEQLAIELETQALPPDVREKEDKARMRMFVLQYVQPGLAGLMDGSVSTLGPLFAAAFATHSNWQTFLVGLAASLGAGISMAFAEALSDDGAITGRGSPILRGAVTGLMTALGGLGHTLPYLVPNTWPHAFWTATGIAGTVVFFELWIIAWVRARYMDTPLLKAIFQIVLGGAIVLATGILIGAS